MLCFFTSFLSTILDFRRLTLDFLFSLAFDKIFGFRLGAEEVNNGVSGTMKLFVLILAVSNSALSTSTEILFLGFFSAIIFLEDGGISDMCAKYVLDFLCFFRAC